MLNIQTKKRLRIFLAIILLMLAGTTYLVFVSSRLLRRLHERTLVGLDVASMIKGMPEKMHLMLFSHLANPKDEPNQRDQEQQFLGLKNYFEQAITNYETTITIQEDHKNMEDLRLAYNYYLTSIEGFWEDTGKASRPPSNSWHQAFLEFDRACEYLYSWKKNRSETLMSQSNNRLALTIQFNLVVLGLLFLMQAVLGIQFLTDYYRRDDPGNF